jgi:hypothetical protein
LPGGHTLRWLYYGSGHLHQVSCDERVVCDLERDALHREIYRTQGALRLSTAYDSVSRKVANWVSQSAGGGAPSWDAFGRGYAQDGVKKAYRYDHAGEPGWLVG